MRKFLTFFLIVAAAAGAFVWWRLTPHEEVATVVVRRGSVAEVVYATGVVEPRRWAKVVSIYRKRIVELCPCEGKEVKKGEVLARLDDVEERALLAELEARRERLRLDAARIRGLVERQSATQTSLDQTTTQLREYEARIAAQKERIDDLVLRAPMDGVVLRRDGEIGEIAGVGVNDVLFWIGQAKPLRIVADVNEEDIPRVRAGQKALLRSEGFKDAPLPASVDEITPKGDPTTKTFRVYLALPDETPLRVGMSVEANIVTQERADALLLPGEAMINGAAYVVAGDLLARREVKTGLRGARLVEILAGVAEGEAVATPAKAGWADGVRVRGRAPTP